MMTDGWIPRRWPPCVEVIDDRMAEIYRRMTPAQRVGKVFEMWDFCRKIVESSERQRDPSMCDAELQRRVSMRMSGGYSH